MGVPPMFERSEPSGVSRRTHATGIAPQPTEGLRPAALIPYHLGMIDIATIRVMLEYTDWSNGKLLDGAAGCTDEQLDRDLQIGPGTLRRILLHTYNGEMIWLKRWRGIVENPWPGEGELVAIADLRSRLDENARARDAWMATLAPSDAARVQQYRDSKGNLFQATLGDMLVQGVMHTKHHQAQAVNALKRLDAAWPELDYMYRVRRAC